jgi:predicted nucleotide-binding protein (sugar kinase/HSP70/actin superfamily)
MDDRKGKGAGIPNYIEERIGMLMEGYSPEMDPARKTVGIPRGLMIYFQQFPYWSTFFKELGFNVLVSGETNNQTIRKSLSMIVAETCFPVEVMHGHIYELLESKADFVFTPFIINAKAADDNPTSNCNCPWIQTFPFMVGASLSEDRREKLLTPTLNFRYYGKCLKRRCMNISGRSSDSAGSRFHRLWPSRMSGRPGLKSGSGNGEGR